MRIVEGDDAPGRDPEAPDEALRPACRIATYARNATSDQTSLGSQPQ